MEQLFAGLDNVFGRLDAKIRTRLQRVLDKPNQRTWNDAYTIILSWKRNYTLWQAVIAVDDTFPKLGPRSWDDGKRERWARIPDRETILKAILLATEGIAA